MPPAVPDVCYVELGIIFARLPPFQRLGRFLLMLVPYWVPFQVLDLSESGTNTPENRALIGKLEGRCYGDKPMYVCNLQAVWIMVRCRGNRHGIDVLLACLSQLYHKRPPWIPCGSWRLLIGRAGTVDCFCRHQVHACPHEHHQRPGKRCAFLEWFFSQYWHIGLVKGQRLWQKVCV